MAYQRGFANPYLVWIEHRASVVTGGPGFTKLEYLYPAAPVLLAVILPHPALSLAIGAALVAGLMAALLLRRVGAARFLVLGLPLLAVPEMWYTASQQLPQVIALTFLAIALQGYIAFATYGETYGGFIAGLALAVSYAADPGALLYAVVMCLFVPLLGAARYKGEPTAPFGVAAVLIFPCIAMAASWSFLIWKFSGTWPGNLDYAPHAHVLSFPLGVAGELRHAAAAAGEDLCRSVLYVAAALLLCLRRRRRTVTVAAGMLLPVLALCLALWLGFAYSTMTAYFLFALLAIVVTAEHRLMDNRAFLAVIIVAAVAQVIIAYAWLPPTPGYSSWAHLMLGWTGWSGWIG